MKLFVRDMLKFLAHIKSSELVLQVAKGPHFFSKNGCVFAYKLQLMDGWMTCDFTSFSTVFQSYQDDERLIMKGCVQWSPVYG